MLSLSLPFEVLLFSEPVDLRKSYDGLAGLVRQYLDRDVLDGGLFVFLNQRRNRIKLLFWEKDGLVIVQKRLELGCFTRPRRTASEGGVVVQRISRSHFPRIPGPISLGVRRETVSRPHSSFATWRSDDGQLSIRTASTRDARSAGLAIRIVER